MIFAVIVAGGKGLRMNMAVRKQYLRLSGRPILGHTLLTFDQCVEIDRLFVVVPPDDVETCRRTVLPSLHMKRTVEVVAGGRERQESVYHGLLAAEAAGGKATAGSIVLIHDAVRPFVEKALIRDCIAGAVKYGACISGIPAHDTLKRTDARGRICKTVPRSDIILAQTPQAFQYPLIRKAHEQALEKGVAGTDDAFLVEKLGETVMVVNGSRFNIKITDPEDIVLAEAILQSRRTT